MFQHAVIYAKISLGKNIAIYQLIVQVFYVGTQRLFPNC